MIDPIAPALRPVLAIRVLPLLLALAPATAVAQAETATESRAVTPLLPPDHWVFPVLGRLDALGALPPEYDPTAWTWTLDEAVRALRAAARPDPRRDPDGGSGASGGVAVELARAAAEALAAEAAEAPTASRQTSGAPSSLALLPAWGAAVHAASSGSLLAGYDTTAGGPPVAPAPGPRRGELALQARLAVGGAPWLAAEVVPALGEGGARVDAGHVVMRPAESFLAWVGRRGVAMGAVAGSPGLILGGPHRLDAVGVALTPGRTLPGPLEWLGPVSVEMVLSKIESAGVTASPWFWGFQGTIRPHPRLRLGMERGALVGGEGNVRVGLREVGETLLGRHGDDSAVSNQVLALDAWYRLPTGSLPLAIYLSWAMDDASGAWVDVPAYMAGIQLAAFPGVPAVTVSAERVYFDESCCGNPPWYRHLQLPWLDGRRPLGHAVAGHGEEWRVRARLDLPGRGLLTALDAFARERGSENLLAPDRIGKSRGVRLRLRYRPTGRRLEVASALGMEVGDGSWRAWDSELAVRVWSW